MKETASEEFIGAFVHSGSPVIDCQFCNRTFYDSGGEFMDEGEIEALEEKRKKEPEKYIPEDGGISWGTISGKQIVAVCDCGEAKRFENWIWNHRWIITSYLRAKAKKQMKDAQYLQAETEAIKGLK